MLNILPFPFTPNLSNSHLASIPEWKHSLSYSFYLEHFRARFRILSTRRDTFTKSRREAHVRLRVRASRFLLSHGRKQKNLLTNHGCGCVLSIPSLCTLAAFLRLPLFISFCLVFLFCYSLMYSYSVFPSICHPSHFALPPFLFLFISFSPR